MHRPLKTGETAWLPCMSAAPARAKFRSTPGSVRAKRSWGGPAAQFGSRYCIRSGMEAVSLDRVAPAHVRTAYAHLFGPDREFRSETALCHHTHAGARSYAGEARR